METKKISLWRKQQQQKATNKFNFEKYKQQSTTLYNINEEIKRVC